mmetsp:Transcript_118042/g.252149  ORF Transcript_118042/g.252149 Transcript_118042/m.252149 type:complete len:263 (-) Transcript_118042:9-797(-)
MPPSHRAHGFEELQKSIRHSIRIDAMDILHLCADGKHAATPADDRQAVVLEGGVELLSELGFRTHVQILPGGADIDEQALAEHLSPRRVCLFQTWQSMHPRRSHGHSSKGAANGNALNRCVQNVLPQAVVGIFAKDQKDMWRKADAFSQCLRRHLGPILRLLLGNAVWLPQELWQCSHKGLLRELVLGGFMEFDGHLIYLLGLGKTCSSGLTWHHSLHALQGVTGYCILKARGLSRRSSAHCAWARSSGIGAFTKDLNSKSS